MTMDPVPVTILTGFLGAGKTTTLNHLLHQSHDRVAVLVNEFGEIPIDGALVRKTDDQIIELNNGCVCCTIRGDMQKSVRELLLKRERRLFRVPFDRIVVETSGMAEPGPLLQTFVSDPLLARDTVLTGVVTLVHAALIEDQLAAYPEALAQLSCADVVVLNHVDRVPHPDAALRAVVARNPIARVVQTERGVVPLAELLQAPRAEPPRATAQHKHSDVQTLSLTSESSICEETLTMWLRSLVLLRNMRILRLKGVLRVKGRSQALVVQGVGEWIEVAPMDAPAPEESAIVFIGTNVDAATIENGWGRVLAA